MVICCMYYIQMILLIVHLHLDGQFVWTFFLFVIKSPRWSVFLHDCGGAVLS